jgi:hypothetical protein
MKNGNLPLLTLGLAAIASTSAFAGVPSAIQACQNISFASIKADCVRAANSHRYYDDRATAVCGRIEFSNLILECIEITGDKTYAPGMVDACADQLTGYEKIDCLGKNGRPSSSGRGRIEETTEMEAPSSDLAEAVGAFAQAEPLTAAHLTKIQDGLLGACLNLSTGETTTAVLYAKLLGDRASLAAYKVGLWDESHRFSGRFDPSNPSATLMDVRPTFLRLSPVYLENQSAISNDRGAGILRMRTDGFSILIIDENRVMGQKSVCKFDR